MAEKIYIDTKNIKSTIVANNIITLKDVVWQEVEETGDRTDVRILDIQRQKEIEERQKERDNKMTEEERSWLLDKFFKTLPSWDALYVKQCTDYDMLEYDAYITYKSSYSKLLNIKTFLEELSQDEEKKYDVSKYETWLEDWTSYYKACDELDNILSTRKKKDYIVKMLTLYQLNNSNEEPPDWQNTDEGWGELPSSKKLSQALWGRTTYYYANDTYTRNRPYLIQKAIIGEDDEPIEKQMKATLSSNTISWTARGMKIEKDIVLTIEYYDMSKVKIEISKGNGITINDTQDDNIKKIVTPIYADEMSASVTIRAYAEENQEVIAEATCILVRETIGKQEPVYLGCFDSVPLSYSHDEVEDHLILGDWWLCKGKGGTSSETDFIFSASYELIDLTNTSLRSSWQVVTDTEKLRQTIPDNIAIGGFAKTNGEFENLLVTLSSILYGKTTIGKTNTDSLTINSSSIINSNATFNSSATFKNNIIVNGTSSLNEDVSTNGNLSVKGKSYLNDEIIANGNLTCGNILSNSNKTYDLGSAENNWNNLFVNNIKLGGVTQLSLKEDIAKTYSYDEDSEVYSVNSLSFFTWKLVCLKQGENILGLAFGYPSFNEESEEKIKKVDLPKFSVSMEEYIEPSIEEIKGSKFIYYFNSVYYAKGMIIPNTSNYSNLISSIDFGEQCMVFTTNLIRGSASLDGVFLAGELSKTYTPWST